MTLLVSLRQDQYNNDGNYSLVSLQAHVFYPRVHLAIARYGTNSAFIPVRANAEEFEKLYN